MVLCLLAPHAHHYKCTSLCMHIVVTQLSSHSCRHTVVVTQLSSHSLYHHMRANVHFYTHVPCVHPHPLVFDDAWVAWQSEGPTEPRGPLWPLLLLRVVVWGALQHTVFVEHSPDGVWIVFLCNVYFARKITCAKTCACTQTHAFVVLCE